MIITISDIFEALVQYRGDKIEALQDLKELKQYIIERPILTTHQIDAVFMREAQENNVCPRCLEPLEVITYGENSEYQGFPVNEKLERRVCPICGRES